MQIEGRNPVTESLKSENPISVIYIQNKIVKSAKIRDIISLAHKRGIRIKKIGRNKLDKISRTKNHQGIIAIVKRKFKSLNEILDDLQENKKDPFFVLINEVFYQQNLGAIIRTAECAGCSGVIIPKRTKITSEVARASMGAIEHIPVIKEAIFNAIKIFKNNAIRIVGIESSGQKMLYGEDLKGPTTFVIGGEHSGVTKSLLNKCDIVLKIPIFGKINSLNMSNAASIAIFEKVRQELTK